jgi:imidazolonepropionase-like amidohydrolase
MVTALVILPLLSPAMPAAQSQTRPIVIRASTVLDGKGGVLRDVALVVDGARIVRIDSNASDVTYDLRGLTVMPGWIDTHTHIAAHFDRETGKVHSPQVNETPQQAMLYAMENAYKTFMSGFTTVQSPGAELDKDLRDWIADGRIPGPRILTSLRSVTDQTGDPAQIRAFIRKAIADGADFVKIFATASIREGGAQTMSDDEIRAACDEANTLGKRSIVHAQGPEGAKAAVLAGCTAIEHGNRLTDEVLDLMVQRGVYFDSNNHLLLHNYLENKARYLGSGNFTEEGFAYMEKGLPIGNDTFRRALGKKVKMIFGTDGGAGAHGRNAEELVYRVRDGGQPPMDAIVSATSLSAQSLRLQEQIGSIARGMEADIIATDGNPLQDITAVRRVVFVMKGGKVYRNESGGRGASQTRGSR